MSGCDRDTCYAVVRGGKLLRLSFSKSLCGWIASKTPGSFVVKTELRLGRRIPPGGESPNGLYAVCKSSSGWPLRVTMFRELAEHWRHPTREIREVQVRFHNTGAAA